MEQFQSLVALAPWTIIASLCNLLIQMLLFKKFLFGPIREILAKRQAEVDKVRTDAAEQLAVAESSRKEYEQHMENARQEADALLRSAAERAGRKSDELLAETQRQVAHMKEKAAADIEQESRKARAEIKDDVSEMVIAVAGKVIGRELNEEDQQQLIDQFIDEVELAP